MTQTAQPVRRVVSGLDDHGRSCIVFDGPAERVIWGTERAPADNGGRADAGGGEFRFDFPVGGTRMVWLELDPGRELPMHATDTLDYGVVVSGRIAFVTETGQTVVGAGDVVVDRGILHGWRVVGDEPCRMVLVMVRAAPVSSGATITGAFGAPE